MQARKMLIQGGGKHKYRVERHGNTGRTINIERAQYTQTCSWYVFVKEYHECQPARTKMSAILCRT